jgi:hypothetical protein
MQKPITFNGDGLLNFQVFADPFPALFLLAVGQLYFLHTQNKPQEAVLITRNAV